MLTASAEHESLLAMDSDAAVMTASPARTTSSSLSHADLKPAHAESARTAQRGEMMTMIRQ